MANKLEVAIKQRYESFNLDIKFTARQGTLGILGPSGCGKSMTLKAIAGIQTLDTGTIIYNDKIWYHQKQKINLKPQQRKVGYLFQNYALFPNMTVSQNIAAGIIKRPKIQRQIIIDKMINKFQLTGLENHYPSSLSGGQQQRVALARIFAYEPEVLLLDEPFSAMDSFLKEKLRLEMGRILKDYHGISILVSHDRDEVYQLCDYLLLMDNGQIIQYGATDDIFKAPINVTAARLTGCKNISKIEKIDDFHVRCLDFNNLVLQVDRKIDHKIKAIGIRAHDFKASSKLHLCNNIKINQYTVSKMPFEWYITLDNGLWWKIEKQMQDVDVLKVMDQYLYIDPSKIILLQD